MTPSGTIRQATSEDVEAIIGLVTRAYQRYVPRMGRRPAPMDDDYSSIVSAGEAFVLEDGPVVGVIVLRCKESHLLVDNIAVDPSHQGRGHGRRLLDFADQRARTCGLAELRLYTNAAMTESIALYRSLGWNEIARRKEAGFSRVYFSKTAPMS